MFTSTILAQSNILIDQPNAYQKTTNWLLGCVIWSKSELEEAWPYCLKVRSFLLVPDMTGSTVNQFYQMMIITIGSMVGLFERIEVTSIPDLKKLWVKGLMRLMNTLMKMLNRGCGLNIFLDIRRERRQPMIIISYFILIFPFLGNNLLFV